MSDHLDSIDLAILRTLQKEGRIQNTELADRVKLSPSPCLRRVRTLEEAGVIQRYVAIVDPEKVGMGLTVFARMWLTGQDKETVSVFVESIQQLPQVLDCYLMAGDCDFLLRIVAADLHAYRRFQIEHLSRIKGVRNIKTDIPMEVVKQTYEIPV